MYELMRMEVGRRLIKRPAVLLERFPMWHGTTEIQVKQIVHDKFDRGKAGTNGMITSNDIFIDDITTKYHDIILS